MAGFGNHSESRLGALRGARAGAAYSVVQVSRPWPLAAICVVFLTRGAQASSELPAVTLAAVRILRFVTTAESCTPS